MKKIISIFITFFIVIGIVIFLALNISNKKEIKNDGNNKIKAIATLFPQYDFLKQIGKDKIEVTLLLPPGTETHTYDPSPKDIIGINQSMLFVYTGRYMEPWAEKIINSIDRDVLILDVSKGIEHIADHTHEGHEEVEYDPHIWLDISNAKVMVDNILDSLIKLDSENTDYYIKNAEEYKEKLEELDNSFIQVINNSKRNTICFGDKFAYMYFITKYNLDYITAYDSCSSSAEPSVSKILEVEERIKEENIPVIFYESLSEGKVAKSIAKDLGIEALVFSSVHTVSSEDIKNGATYISVMEKNLEALQKALN